MSNRRSFIRQAGVIAGTSILASVLQEQVFAEFCRKWSASDRINIGAIGINGMGGLIFRSSLNNLACR